MRDAPAPAPLRLPRLGALLLLSAAWGLAGTGRAEEPARPPRLTAEQQKKLQQAQRHQEEAIKLLRQNKIAEGVAEWQKKLALERSVWGKDHPNVVPSLQHLARLQEAVDEFAGARQALREVLAIQVRRLGEKHWEVGEARRALADLDFRAKLKPADRALLLQANVLNWQASQLWEAGRSRQALPLAKRAVEIRGKLLEEGHPDYARSLFNLAAQYKVLAEYDRAEALYRRGLVIVEARLDRDHPDLAITLNNLAMLYLDQGQYARAEPLFKRSFTIWEAGLGKDHVRVAHSLNNLARLYLEQGLYARAEPLLRRSLLILEARLGKDHPNVAISLNNLAALYLEQRQYARAEPLYRRSQAIREARLGKDHPDVAQSLNNLAQLYHQQGQYGQAEPLYQRSLAITEARLGKDHPHLAISLNSLAGLYRDQGQYGKAEPLYRRGLAILEARLGKDHLHVAHCLDNLAGLYGLQGRWGEAVQASDQARRGLRRHLLQVLPALSPQEQLTYLHTQVERNLPGALSLGLVRRGDPGVAERSAGWLLNSKALTQQALTEPLRLARAGGQPRLTALLGQLRDVRQRLARLSLAAPQPGQEQQRRERLEDLARQERQLTGQLGQQSGEQLADPGWVELAAVRQALPSEAVLIEIARFDVFDFRAKGGEWPWQPARYAAWVIPPHGQGKVCLIDLGEAAPIETAVRAVRRLLAAAPRDLAGQNEAAVERRLRRALDDLAGRLLRPLAGHIGKSAHWIFSPDAALWLVPWCALPLGDGSYAVEKHRLSYVVSGRDLVRPPDNVPGTGALVLADPDFDLRPARASKEAKTALVMRGLLPGTHLPRFARLPGTAREARAIAPLLERYAGQQPAVRTDKEAREEAFKAARRPKVVVLSTHGYFLEDQDRAVVPTLAGLEGRGLKLAGLERPRPKGDKVQVLENPLLRCGLALAGANQRDRAPEGAEDGVLTGLEIVGCDLRGTELVVLSACETGLGKVNVGEGVAGLRQAFQLAGAQAVVATLWQIPDTETTELMQAFFTHLAAKRGKAEALRRAQLEVIKQRRARGKAAHPFYWAAFTLTGQWQ
jgi:CHAT domain-containing protein/Tfp pilus assembly protein PilF